MCDKKQFSKREAQGALNRNRHIKSKKGQKRRKEVRFYHCPECNMWHLTSKI